MSCDLLPSCRDNQFINHRLNVNIVHDVVSHCRVKTTQHTMMFCLCLLQTLLQLGSIGTGFEFLVEALNSRLHEWPPI